MSASERNPLGRFLLFSVALHVALAVGLRVEAPRARELREPLRVRVVDLVEPEEYLKRLPPREPEVLSRFTARASGRERPSAEPKLSGAETRIPSPAGVPLAALPRPGDGAPLPRPRAFVEPAPLPAPPAAPRSLSPAPARPRPAPPREEGAPRVAPGESPQVARPAAPPVERRVEAGRAPLPGPAAALPERRPTEREEAARVARSPLPKPPAEVARPAAPAPAPTAPSAPADPLALLRPPSPRPEVGRRPDRGPDLSLTPEDLAAISQRRRQGEARADEGESVSLDTQEFKYVSYFAHIKRKIEMVWSYPEDAARRGISGNLLVKFVLREDGSLARLELLRTSGYPILDEEALSAIAKAAPFNPFPKTIRQKLLPIDASFEYIQAGRIEWRLR